MPKNKALKQYTSILHHALNSGANRELVVVNGWTIRRSPGEVISSFKAVEICLDIMSNFRTNFVWNTIRSHINPLSCSITKRSSNHHDLLHMTLQRYFNCNEWTWTACNRMGTSKSQMLLIWKRQPPAQCQIKIRIPDLKGESVCWRTQRTSIP